MKYTLGIDVGGTKVASGLVDSKLKVINYTSSPTTSHKYFLEALELLIRSYTYGLGFEAIGLGLPGQILQNGMVKYLPHIPEVRNINIQKHLTAKFKVPVRVINDAKAFTLAEAKIGAGKRYKSVMGITLGTGIGTGFILNNNLYVGKDGIAAEFGHIMMMDGKTLENHIHEVERFHSALHAKKFLKILFGAAVLSYNPEIIILGGAWSKLPGMEKLANELTSNVGNFKTKTPVKVSKLKHASIIGAALALKQGR